MRKKGLLMIVLIVALGFLFVGCNSSPTITMESNFTTTVGETAELKPTIAGSKADLTLKFVSDTASVATVSDTGVVSALAAGTAKITVSIEEYPEVFVVVTVTVKDVLPSISIEPTFTTTVGDTAELSAIIKNPRGALTLAYSSDDEEVATVNNGVITAVAAGTAKIKVSIVQFPTVFVEVTVTVNEMTILLAPSFATTVGDTTDLQATLNSAIANLTLLYTSSHPEIATVSTEGVVTAVSPGVATITASVEQFPNVTSEVVVTVNPITISMNSSFTAAVGDTAILDALINSANQDLTLVYASDNTEVATVNNGVITAVSPGVAKITVSVAGHPDVVAEITVTVVDYAPTIVSLTGSNVLLVGDTETYTPIVIPTTANKTIIWQSSNPSVAIVDVDGVVKALSPGVTTITITSALNPNIKNTLLLTVKEEGTDAEIGLRALNYVLAGIPEYVSNSFNLPKYPNQSVSVVWENAFGTVITSGIYNFTAIKDGNISIFVTIQYGSYFKKQTVPLKLVVDPDNNNFIKTQNVKLYFDLYFSQWLTSGENKLSLIKHLNGTTITWTSNKPDVISSSGIITRPSDDTVVQLTANIKSDTIQLNAVYNLTVIGYTQAEKIAYMFEEGIFSTLHEQEVKSSITLLANDPKFGASLTWVSDKPGTLDNNGNYMNSELSESDVVTYTVTVKYEAVGFEFEADVLVQVTVMPLDDVGLAVFAFIASDPEIMDHVAYGAGGVPGRITGLPLTLDGHEGVIISWYGKEGEFDAEMFVLKQYLLYRPTEIYAKFSKPGCGDAVVTFAVNIGIMSSAESFGFTARTVAFSTNHVATNGMPAADGGTGTVYTLGFGQIYFRSRFVFPGTTLENDYYFFTAKGNYLEWDNTVITVDGGKNYINPTLDGAKLTVLWSSCARVWKNNTEEAVYVKLNEVVSLGGQIASDAYTVFVVDANGLVTTGNISPLGGGAITEVEIPAGGYMINPAFLDGPNLRPFGTLGNVIEIHSFTERIVG